MQSYVTIFSFLKQSTAAAETARAPEGIRPSGSGGAQLATCHFKPRPDQTLSDS